MTNESEEQNNFKEKAYEILYNKYKSVLSSLIQRSYNLENRSKDTGELLKENRQEYIDKKIELAEDLSKVNEVWIKKGFISKEDMEVINAREHCLNKHEFFKRK